MSNRKLPLDMGRVLIPLADGHSVSQRTLHLIEAIRDYHDKLDVKWIPDDLRKEGEPQFAITERLGDGREEIVFHVMDEAHFDGSVLERIIQGDTSRRDVLSEIDAKNEAIERLKGKMIEEQRAVANDIAIHALRSPLNKYKVDDDLIIRQ